MKEATVKGLTIGLFKN